VSTNEDVADMAALLISKCTFSCVLAISDATCCQAGSEPVSAQ
jgi:hypothetical protein